MDELHLFKVNVVKLILCQSKVVDGILIQDMLSF